MLKYQQRDRWSHGDLLRLPHPKAPTGEHNAVFRWILAGADALGERTVTRRVQGEAGLTRMSLSPRMRLDDVIKRIGAIPMGGTDCALPMIWARRQKLNLSAFITYTDSETRAEVIASARA